MKNNKYSIITCASYGSSGSGIVTDYLKEFNGIYNPGDFEFRFIQDYDGISTLEDALVHSPHRLNSDIAIRNYQRYVDRQCGTFLNRRYEKYFNGQWKRISSEFLKKLIDVEWPGYWEQYQIMSPTKFHAFVKYQLYPRLMRLIFANKKPLPHYLPKCPMYFSSPTEEYFIECVKDYINELCNIVDPEHRFNYLYFDQMMPPANIGKYERYFDSIKTIVVDRDPRDYYIDILRWGESWIPKNPDEYARLFKKMREQAQSFEDSNNVLRLRLEDTIFKYDEFDMKMQNFLNLSENEHIDKFKFFNPEISAKNTHLWTKRPIDMAIIHRIEELLPEYLYDFESVGVTN